MNEPSEYHCYLAAIDGLRRASDALRALAAQRKDAKWLKPVRLLDEVQDRLGRMKDEGGPPILWLPNKRR
jgi:hypothetical protein